MPLSRQMFRWGVASGISFSVNLGLTVLLHEVFGVEARLAYGVALITVMGVNFCVQRFYVFEHRQGAWHQQLALFVGTSFGFRGLEYLAYLAIQAAAPERLYWLIIIVVSVVSLVVKFFLSKLLVFRSPAPRYEA